MSGLNNLSTYYVPEGETRRITIVGVSVGTSDPQPLAFVDGTALYLLCTVTEAETDDPLLLKQFGSDQLLLAGLTPRALEPGQEVEITRYEGGGYEVEIDPDQVEEFEDAM